MGTSGFLLMLGIGTMYGLSAVQRQLPRLLHLDSAWAPAPFAAASVGLLLGCVIAARVLGRWGPRLAGGAGTLVWGLGVASAGIGLALGDFRSLLAGFAAGGVGVGVAYLAIVATVGPRMLSRPLAGSAIGPLGFTAGAILFVSAAVVGGLPEKPAPAAGAVVGWIGVAVALTGAVAWPGMRAEPLRPVARARLDDDARSERDLRAVRRTASLLLLINALPGMLVFATATQLVAEWTTPAGVGNVELVVAAVMPALFLGGLFAPSMSGALGARRSFVLLLLIRGIVLTTLPFRAGLPSAVILTAVVLFGHGAGFSLLPSLVGGRDRAERFPHNYGAVLVAWGIAGIAGSLLAVVSLALGSSLTPALCLVGVMALLGACWLALPRTRRGRLFAASAD